MVPIACSEVVAPGQSRRDFILVAASALGAFGALGKSRLVFAQEAGNSKKLSLSISGYKFDRVAALADGRVAIEGCDVHFETASIGDRKSVV
jgi:hypothetical protein